MPQGHSNKRWSLRKVSFIFQLFWIIKKNIHLHCSKLKLSSLYRLTPHMSGISLCLPGQSWEHGPQVTSLVWAVGTQVSQHLLLTRIWIGNIVVGIWTRKSSHKCEHSNWWFNCFSKCMLLPGTFLQESYENDDLVDNVTSAFRNSCNSHDIFLESYLQISLQMLK